MSLLKQIWFGSGSALQIWTIDEDVELLFRKAELGEHEMSLYEKITHPKRQLEFLASRVLLHNVDPENQILYNQSGAPYLDNNRANVSVSHTDGVVCLLHSPQRCGIDVETIGSRALRLSHRFLSKSEMRFIDEEHPGRSATLIWSVKETLFKMLRKEGIDFATQLLVRSIEPKNHNTIRTSIITEKSESEHVVHFDFIGDKVLTWAFDENQLCNEHI